MVPAPLVALLAAATLLALFAVNLMTLAAIDASRVSIARSRRAQRLLSAIHAGLLDAETGQRGFLLTRRGDYLEPFQSAFDEIPGELGELLDVVADDPEQERDAREVKALATRKLAELRLSIDLYLKHQATTAVAIVRSDSDRTLMDRIRAALAALGDQEEHRLTARTTVARQKLERAIWIDVVAGSGLLALGFMLFRINRDIARRELLEARLREEVSFQEQFIGILGHDLRNPLSAIAMNARRLSASSISGQKLTRSAELISSAAERMRRMVDQLLDLTRARRGGGIPVQRRSETDLVQIAERTTEELRSANPNAEVVIDAQEPVFGSWDSDRLMQAVSNLVGNAIVHGRGRVNVRVQGVGDRATLEVHNGGPPVPDEIRGRLFQAFHGRARGGVGHNGLGLGLFITERIIHAHGGRVHVRSSEADGTTFTIELPTRSACTRPEGHPHGADTISGDPGPAATPAI